MPLLMSALWSCFVFTQCALKTVGLQQQQGFFPKWQSKYISSSLPRASKILISARSKLAGWPLIKEAFIWYHYLKRRKWILQTCVWQQTLRGAWARVQLLPAPPQLNRWFYVIIRSRIDVFLPHRGRPWRCPQGPCCSPRSPERGCSRPLMCLTRTGCRFHSGSTPARPPPPGFHPCWSHAGPVRRRTTCGGDQNCLWPYFCSVVTQTMVLIRNCYNEKVR